VERFLSVPSRRISSFQAGLLFFAARHERGLFSYSDRIPVSHVSSGEEILFPFDYVASLLLVGPLGAPEGVSIPRSRLGEYSSIFLLGFVASLLSLRSAVS